MVSAGRRVFCLRNVRFDPAWLLEIGSDDEDEDETLAG